MHKQSLKKLIQSSFTREEMLLLMADEAFRRMLDEAKDLSDYETLARYGGNLLTEREFPRNQPSLKSDARS